MTHSDILHDPHLLLRESAWLQRLARSLCSDHSLADDLSQDALLAAWQHRGRLRGPLRPWLAGVLRRLAANRTRAEARRQRRQAQAATAPDQTAPATDEVVARATLYRGVVDAVTKLSEPYRTAILLRYFDDLPPRQIAARLEVSVETVRTRIKRGIALLRVRMDGEHGSRAAWLAPLSAITEWGTTGASVGALTLVSVVLMTMQLKILLPLLAVAGLGMLYFWPDTLSQDEATQSEAAEDPLAAMKAATQVDPTPTGEPEANRKLLALVTSARVHGRVIRFADDEPVQGQEVLLMPSSRGELTGADGQSRPEVQSQHGVSPLARAVTDREGRFVLKRNVRELAECEVQVHALGYMAMSSRTLHLRPGQSRDLGTCQLYQSTVISGRVRDTEEQPVENLRVWLSWLPWSGGWESPFQLRLLQRRQAPLVTDAAGQFRTDQPWPTGSYRIRLEDPSLTLAQESRAVRKIGPGTFLDLVVTRLQEQLVGTVVGAAGEPAAGLTVLTLDGGSYARSGEDGSFVLRRRRGSGKEFRLVVWRDQEFRLLETEETFTWGQKGVRLVLPRGESFTLQVVQASHMRPIEGFDLSLQRVGDHRGYSSGGSVSGHNMRTHHPNGLIKLSGLLPGTYRVLVVQPLLSVEQSFEVRQDQQSRKLVLPSWHDLAVFLVGGDGQPVAGSLCELVQRPKADTDLALAPRRRVGEVGGARRLSAPWHTLRLAGEKTNGEGRATLRVPDLEHLLLRIHGKDHTPVLYRGDLHPESGCLRIVVPRGARLAGRLEPAAFARTMRPRLVLRSLDEPGVWFPERFSQIPAGQSTTTGQLDGSYCLQHIPAGSWEVFLFFITPGRGSAGLYNQHPLSVVRDLKPGESRKLDLTVMHLVPARVRGQAMFGGKPAPLAWLSFKGEKRAGLRSHAFFDTDQYGRFEGSLVPGSYQVEAVVRDPKTGEDVVCTFLGRLTVTAGAELSPTLDLVPAKPKQAR